MTVRRVGFVVHSGRDGSRQVAAGAAKTLAARGIELVIVPDDRDAALPEDLREHAVVASTPAFAADVDVVLSFGGDGTFLRAAHLCRDTGVPLLGVNLGRLGFLAEVEVDELDQALDVVARGDFITEERATLEAGIVHSSGEIDYFDWALNEVSIEKTARQRLLLMDVHIGGQLFAKVPADALVVATSTGSTAYALSAGGPILAPQVNGTLVVPVAPHSLFDRTVVAAANDDIDIDLLPSQHSALVSCDGREPIELPVGSRIRVCGSAQPLKIARIEPLAFYELVRRKFGLH